MMKHLNPLADTHEWFVRAVSKPTMRNLAVQCGVHFEEVAEFACEIQTNDPELLSRVKAAHAALEDLGNYLKKDAQNITFTDRVATLDSICDQVVTATGVAWMLDMDPVGGLAEVNRSNWSKFVNGMPQFDLNGKILKAGEYTPPNLNPFV